jgi:hypothetical protein
MIHVDWHFARPHHHRLSLEWSSHWLFGMVFFAVAGWYVARRWSDRPWRAAAWNVALALILAQGIEPCLRRRTPVGGSSTLSARSAGWHSGNASAERFRRLRLAAVARALRRRAADPGRGNLEPRMRRDACFQREIAVRLSHAARKLAPRSPIGRHWATIRFRSGSSQYTW